MSIATLGLAILNISCAHPIHVDQFKKNLKELPNTFQHSEIENKMVWIHWIV
ncbi:MAG: hypothetical protein KAI34_02270 [Candidatus Lokiarchaeota archaeon]|nr:hypothetical protein [Candidatus Lokiarchaeota archaeon]